MDETGRQSRRAGEVDDEVEALAAESTQRGEIAPPLRLSSFHRREDQPVHIRIPTKDSGVAWSNKRGDLRVGKSMAQRGQRRRSEQCIADGRDESDEDTFRIRWDASRHPGPPRRPGD